MKCAIYVRKSLDSVRLPLSTTFGDYHYNLLLSNLSTLPYSQYMAASIVFANRTEMARMAQRWLQCQCFGLVLVLAVNKGFPLVPAAGHHYCLSIDIWPLSPPRKR